jgi:hypothetical protein
MRGIWAEISGFAAQAGALPVNLYLTLKSIHARTCVIGRRRANAKSLARTRWHASACTFIKTQTLTVVPEWQNSEEVLCALEIVTLS